MENEYKISSYDTSHFYYKGNLDNFEIWNDGYNDFVKETELYLYLSDGSFYKKEYKKEYKNNIKSNVKYDNICIQKAVIQIDYKFYIVPVYERISIYEGRWILMQMLKRFGVKGFINTLDDMPLEYSFIDNYRLNIKSFIEFDYDEYIKNYNIFLKNNSQFERQIIQLKRKNIDHICKFYNVNENELCKIKNNRLKYAIKALNNKINNNRKNN